jgi:hypothetical protein
MPDIRISPMEITLKDLDQLYEPVPNSVTIYRRDITNPQVCFQFDDPVKSFTFDLPQLLATLSMLR